MELEDNEVINVFNYGKGISKFKLNLDQQNFIELVGKPDLVEKDTSNVGEYTETLIYNQYSILAIFSYYDNLLDNCMLFSTNNLWIDGVNIFTINKNKVFETIRRLHHKLNLEYDVLDEKYGLDNSYYFKNIGLTIWINNNYVNDTCISIPEGLTSN
jgi:hypothetical protein